MSRTVERTIEIAAGREAVWLALTDPQELARWFCLKAWVTPGQGGTIGYSWGPPWEGESRIDVWEPERRLVMVSRTAEGKEQWLGEGSGGEAAGTPLILEFRLEGSGGSTTLRLVHSGFGDGAAWDDEFDGVRRGWTYELDGLKHYLERHRGKARRIVWVRREAGASRNEAWRRLTGAGGLTREGIAPQGKPGFACAFTMDSGERLEGSLLLWDPPAQFAMTVENMGDGLFRIEMDRSTGRLEATAWLAVWGDAAADTTAIQARWRARIEELLAPLSPPAAAPTGR